MNEFLWPVTEGDLTFIQGTWFHVIFKILGMTKQHLPYRIWISTAGLSGEMPLGTFHGSS